MMTVKDLMKAREDQTYWLAKLVEAAQRESSLPVILLGRSYKPGTNLVVGSPAILLSSSSIPSSSARRRIPTD